MSIEPDGTTDGARRDADRLLARAGGADARVHARLEAAIADIFLPPDARLDDHSRAALAALHLLLVTSVAGEIREHATRLLAGRGAAELGSRIDLDPLALANRLAESGLLRDPAFVHETLARTRQTLIAAALAPVAPGEPERASLASRLSSRPDRVVASGAVALMVAESRRRDTAGRLPLDTDLPADLHHKLVWWVAAAMREAAQPADAALDRALADAALRSLAAHDEGERLEAVAMRLAAAIDAQADELPSLLAEALDDRQLALAIGLVAHAIGVEYDLAREIVLDPAADRFALALRAFQMDRREIARILFALAEADPRRDEQAVADEVATVLVIAPAAARAAIMPLTLHRDFRSAVLALAQGRA